jgi:hypothetical protein
MDDEEQSMQEQMDTLRHRVDANRGDIDAHGVDIGELQKAGHVDRVDIDRLQVGAEVDRYLIAELQAEGLLRAEHAAQMETALKAARVIGAAIGIVMAASRCTQEQAFQVLVKVSQNSNRKLREVADDVVLTGGLPSVRVLTI